jgi:hypothetical protein
MTPQCNFHGDTRKYGQQCSTQKFLNIWLRDKATIPIGRCKSHTEIVGTCTHVTKNREVDFSQHSQDNKMLSAYNMYEVARIDVIIVSPSLNRLKAQSFIQCAVFCSMLKECHTFSFSPAGREKNVCNLSREDCVKTSPGFIGSRLWNKEVS